MMAPAGTNGQRRSVCQALLLARSGTTVSLSKDSCNCPGGAWHLGLEPRPSGDIYNMWEEFLINGERLFCSPATVHRTMVSTSPPPLGRADHVVISPLEKADLMPDLVVFLCNPEQACRLVTLATYPDGRPPKPEMAGSTCHMVIAYPLVTGEMNISLMDYASRMYQGYEPGELFVTVPYGLVPGLMWSLSRCGAGTADTWSPRPARPRGTAGEEAVSKGESSRELSQGGRGNRRVLLRPWQHLWRGDR